MNSQVLKIVAICNRLRIAPKSLREEVERELVEAAKELAQAETETPVSTRDEIEEAIARHREVLAMSKDPEVIAQTVGKVRRLQARLTTTPP